MGYNWFGMTHGLNGQNVFLDPGIITYAQQLGIQYFRLQYNASFIWVNYGDDPSIWNYANLDDGFNKIIQGGMIPVATIRNFPTWCLDGGLNNQWFATSEPMDFPSAYGTGGTPNTLAYFCYNFAKHYDGKTITTLGFPIRVNFIGWNEEENIHFTPGTTLGTITTSANIVNNTKRTQVGINASAIFAPQYSVVQFPSSGSAQAGNSQYCQLSQDLNINDNTMHIAAIIDGSLDVSQPFVSPADIPSGTVTVLDQRGFRSNPSSLYNGLYATSNPTKPQPARDPHYAAITQKAVYNSIKAGGNQLVGAPVEWWIQNDGAGFGGNQYIGAIGGNYFTYYQQFFGELNAAGTGYSFADWLDFHYYTKTVDPSTGSANTYQFLKALQDIRAASLVGGHATKTLPIWISEIGWNTKTEVDEPTQAANYAYVLPTFKQFTIQDGAPNTFILYTVDHGQGAATDGASLVGFNGTTYYFKAAWNVVQNFVAAQPKGSLLT